MASSGKIAGLILMVVGMAIFLVAALYIASGFAGGQVQLPGAILGIVLFGVLPLLLFGGAGAFLYGRGRAEEHDLAEVRRKERLLGLIQAQGQVSLGNIMAEMKMTRDEVKAAIYDLVSLGLFAGYIDWGAQTFFSEDAARVGSTKCPNCGGVRELAGKGIVKCPYCGVELFIPPAAPQSVAAGQQPTTTS